MVTRPVTEMERDLYLVPLGTEVALGVVGPEEGFPEEISLTLLLFPGGRATVFLETVAGVYGYLEGTEEAARALPERPRAEDLEEPEWVEIAEGM